MSTMIVKVRTVEAVLPHPNADRLEIAMVGGWKSICRKGELQAGQKVVFFPPDSILPPALAEDPPAGRLGVAKYCSLLPRNEQGVRPPGYRVKAARLRGQPSFGLVMALDRSRGDLDWPADTDVAEFYGIEKWEPPLKCEAGDSAPEHPWFPKYTDIEHYANYPTAIADGEEVVITEKIHGTNARCGLVLAAAEDGSASGRGWPVRTTSAGSSTAASTARLDAVDLCQKGYLPSSGVQVGQVIDKDGHFLAGCRARAEDEMRKLFLAVQVDKDGNETPTVSEYWMFLDDRMQEALTYIRDNSALAEAVRGAVIYGEIFGSGVQDLAYGLVNGKRGFRVFDIAVNGEYLDYDEKAAHLRPFRTGDGAMPVPRTIQPGGGRTTDGRPHDHLRPAACGAIPGTGGIVVTPVKERFSDVLAGRCILKSVSADYLDRKDAQDNKN